MIRLIDLLNEARTVSKPIKVDNDTMIQIVGDDKGFRELTAALNPKTGKPIQKFGFDRGNETAKSKEELIKKLQKKYGNGFKFESVNENNWNNLMKIMQNKYDRQGYSLKELYDECINFLGKQNGKLAFYEFMKKNKSNKKVQDEFNKTSFYESVNEGNVKLPSSAKKFWNTPAEKLIKTYGSDLRNSIPPSQWNTHPEIIDGYGQNAGPDIFKQLVRDNLMSNDRLDPKLAKMIGIPTDVSIIDYLNDGGSGLNGNKYFTKYKRWTSALYDIYDEMQKKFGKMKPQSVGESVNEEFTAISNKSGKTVVFKDKDARDAAVKAGTHSKEDEKAGGDEPKGEKKPNMFSKDTGYDAGDKKSEPKSDEPNQDNPFGVDRLVYNKRTKTVGIVRMADERGETKTDADGNVNTSELEPYNPFKYPHQKDAKVAPSTEKEISSRGLFQPFAQNGPIIQEPKSEPKQDGPVKDSSGGRAGNPQVNKATKKKAEELGITPSELGREEYEKTMVQAAVAALTDSNYHSEARQLIAMIENKPEWKEDPRKSAPSFDSPEYDEWQKSSVYSSEYYDADSATEELGQTASQEAGWNGVDAVDGIAFELKTRGFVELAKKIQSVIKENKSMKLTSMLK